MEPLVRWLLTYLVHSTVLLGAAWLARVALRERRLALQEAVLRAALVGGFVTASLQVGLDLRPLGGALAVPSPRPVAAVVPAAAPIVDARHRPRSPRPGRGARSRPRPCRRGPGRSPTRVAARWRVGLGAAWAGLALLALARLAVAALRLRRLLHGRRPIAAGELAPGAAALGPALGLRAPVRLSAAERLSAPLATGVLRPEVCLPTRAVAELGRRRAGGPVRPRARAPRAARPRVDPPRPARRGRGARPAAQRLGAPPPPGPGRVPQRRPRGRRLRPAPRPRPLARGRRVVDARRAALSAGGGGGSAQRPQPSRPSRGETHGHRPHPRAPPPPAAPGRRDRRPGDAPS